MPPELAPYNVNYKIVQLFQFDPEMNIETAIADIANKWAGKEFSAELIKAWKLTEEAILGFPNVVPLYSTIGFTWYRLWVRPFVPNLEAISDQDRAFYEDYICTTPHNPNNVDLSRDVLFQLTTPEKCKVNIERINKNVWVPLDKAIAVLSKIEEAAAQKLGAKNVIYDQLIRLKALRCWFVTQRSVAEWIASVYSYMNAKNSSEKKKAKQLLKAMIEKEIANTEALSELLDSDVEFMATTNKGETPLIYGDNLKELLPKRIALMRKHADDEPFIDPNYIEKKAGQPISVF
jgi:hypothetical protein